jgi:cell division transport system permease protein
MKLGFFGKEAVRSMSRNAMPSFAAMATVLVTILVLGVFIPVVQATTGAANEVRGRVLLDVYMKLGAKPSDIERVRLKLSEKTPNVKRVEFVSKANALRDEAKKSPEAYELIGKANPLPDTFRVTPSDPSKIDLIRNALAPGGNTRPSDPAIDEIRDRRNDTNKILAATRVVKLSMALLAALLIAASTLLIANTIRLSLFARRREVEVMKLVGATDWFIRWPFVIEGVFVGAAGASFAVLMLVIAKLTLIDPLSNDFALIAAPGTINFGFLILLLGASAIGVSAIGSGISLRRFLRV